MNILNLLASNSFIVVNKSLIKELGLEPSILFGEIVSEYNYWNERDGLNDGFFYSTVENIEEKTTLSKYQQGKAIKKLKELNLIECKVKGLPAKRYFKINLQQVVKFFNSELASNLTSSSQKTSQLEVKKLDGNNNIINNNIINNKKEKEKRNNIYLLITNMYNDTCVSFPHLRSLSDSRKRAIKARLNKYTLDDFKTLFELAEASDFLKGNNSRNWTATFDWLIKDSNMAKVLDGNYNNRTNRQNNYSNNLVAQELDDFYKMANEWANS